jgi:hypothetical protein
MLFADLGTGIIIEKNMGENDISYNICHLTISEKVMILKEA